MKNINGNQNLFFKRFGIIILTICIIMSCSVEVTAKQLTGTVNDQYRKSFEEKYGFNIIIDEIVVNKDGFYTYPVSVIDIELKVLKDIDSAFSMLPAGFVKEINDYFKKQGYSPKIKIYNEEFVELSDAAGYFDPKDISINLARNGNDLIGSLLHEFGHEVRYSLQKNKSDDIEKYFVSQNKNSKYQYNENYKRLYDITLNSEYYDYYLREYSSCNFLEDFADLFSSGVMQYRYLSSYGNGTVKPIHNKIKKMSEVLCKEFTSLKDSKFLLNCMPDAPAKWAAMSVKKAKENGIVPWGIYGLNTADLTKYDAALILQPFLYKYINEDILLKKANIKKDAPISEIFVYDVLDGEDVWLLHHLKILEVENGRFNPNQKIQSEWAAAILTRVAQLCGLEDKDKTNYALNKCNDAAKVSNWARPYVKFVLSLNIMSADGNNNFNPKRYITYQEFYNSLLNISNLKKEYNKQNKINLPETDYYQDLNGSAVSKNGWIYYYSTGEFTGKGKYIYVFDDGSWFEYEGEWKNGGFWNGKEKYVYNDGSWFEYEGEWKNGEFWNGKYKGIYGDGSYLQREGEWKDGYFWKGKEKVSFINGAYYEYEGEQKNGEFLKGKEKYVYNDGSWFEYEGEWKNGEFWNGKYKGIYGDGSSYEIEYINGETKNR